MNIFDPNNYTVTVQDPGGSGRTATFAGKDGRHYIENEGELIDLTESIPNIEQYARGIANMIAYNAALEESKKEKEELKSSPAGEFEYFDGDNQIYLFSPSGKVYRGSHGNDSESSKEKFLPLGESGLFVTDLENATYAIHWDGSMNTFYSVSEVLNFETASILIEDGKHPYYSDETARIIYVVSDTGEKESIDWYSSESVPHLVPGTYPLVDHAYTFMTDIKPYERTVFSASGYTYLLEKDEPSIISTEDALVLLTSLVRSE